MRKIFNFKKYLTLCIIGLVCFCNEQNGIVFATEPVSKEIISNYKTDIDSDEYKKTKSTNQSDLDLNDYFKTNINFISNNNSNDHQEEINNKPYIIPDDSEKTTTDNVKESNHPKRVIVHNNRYLEPSTSHVAKNVCYITAGFGDKYSQGTGFLIGPNTVATSAHVIYNDSLNRLCTNSTIQIGNNIAHGVFYSYDPNYSSTHSRQDDWALIELDRPLGNELGYFGFSKNSTVGQELYLSGFHSDLSGLYTGTGKILSFDTLGKSFDHDCDVIKGSSGSPLYDKSTHIAYGINSGEYLSGNRNVATKINSFVYQNMVSAKVQYSLPNHGYVDAVTTSEIRGWALDPTTVSTRYVQKFVDSYIYDSNGIQMTGIRTKAEKYREDVGYHAFSTSINWLRYKPGTYTIKSYAISINGEDRLLNHSGITYTVRPSTGHVDTVNASSVAGWVYKPDAPNDAINARIYFFNADTGAKIHEKSVVANIPRNDLINAGIGNGNHGFVYNINLNSMPANRIRIEVYAADGSGSVPLIYSGIYVK